MNVPVRFVTVLAVLKKDVKDRPKNRPKKHRKSLTICLTDKLEKAKCLFSYGLITCHRIVIYRTSCLIPIGPNQSQKACTAYSVSAQYTR